MSTDDRTEWTWEVIERDWLGGGQLADEPDVVVAAFNRVRAEFGDDWIEATRTRERARGALPTLNVVVLGKQLVHLDGAHGCEGLLKKFRQDDESARAELAAISLIVPDDGSVGLECEPSVRIGERVRKPDFRVKAEDGPWTYVEVTQPNRSAVELRVHDALRELGGVLESVPGHYTVEVFFLKQPTDTELRALRPILEELCASDGRREVVLDDALGVVYLNDATPGEYILNDHGFPKVPGLGRMTSRVEAGETVRHVVVRMPYVDTRGHQFLATEAAQLPDSEPGVIMIQMSGAPGGMKTWAPTLENELRLGLYDQVSAICLFGSSVSPTVSGEALTFEAVLIVNDDAKHALPVWLETRLRQVPLP
jgi:hypothetical protein